MSADPVAIELREHDRRLGGLHKRLGATEVIVSDHSSRLVHLETTETERGKDFVAIEKAIEDDRRERREGEQQTRRAIYTLAAFMGTSALSICGLIAVLVNHA